MKKKIDVKIEDKIIDKLMEENVNISLFTNDCLEMVIDCEPEKLLEYYLITNNIILKDLIEMIENTKTIDDLNKLNHYVESIEDEKVKEIALCSFDEMKNSFDNEIDENNINTYVLENNEKVAIQNERGETVFISVDSNGDIWTIK